MNLASKRIIIREGVPPILGASVALQFDRDYVKTGALKTGDYHYRSYAHKETKTDESFILTVWHTKSSIIVALPSVSTDEPEEDTK